MTVASYTVDRTAIQKSKTHSLKATIFLFLWILSEQVPLPLTHK